MERCLRKGRRPVLVTALVVAVVFGSAAGAPAAPLTDGRAYELVSPPGKNGADIVAESSRTRAAADGDAIAFVSLVGFGDLLGKAVTGEYLSQRAEPGDPGTNGWGTHSILPPQGLIPIEGLLSDLEPAYVGEFSEDLSAGVYSAYRPVTDAPSVANVMNLYRRTDLRASGAGTYDLVTECPLCDVLGNPLPELPAEGLAALHVRPDFAWADAGFERIVFQSKQSLTNDAPGTLPDCDLTISFLADACPWRLYEWNQGRVTLAQILPDGEVADAAVAGRSTRRGGRTPHVLSDGTDGHSRLFFVQQTDAAGQTPSELGYSERVAVNSATSGNIFMRVDGAVTEQVNLSEGGSGAFAPATFLDASKDGKRAFFMTEAALTGDAVDNGLVKVYMYDATRPGAAPDNLTLLTSYDDDGGDVAGVGGVSDDGHYVYILAQGQLVPGGESLRGTAFYLWHDGEMRFVGRAPSGQEGGNNLVQTAAHESQARVTPDGRHFVFGVTTGTGPTGYDHGDCVSQYGVGCRQLYVYSANDGRLGCVSCNVNAAEATADATIPVRRNNGGSRPTSHMSRAIDASGSRVFFSTAEALVPDDTNGRIDAYQYDVATGEHHLLSSGKSTSDSWFLDASVDGDDVFVLTREQLVGWDRDGAYDIYDARVGGGFPEPPPTADPCSGESCRTAATDAPSAPPLGTAAFQGAGNEDPVLTPRPKRCTRRRATSRTRGKARARGRGAKVRSQARHRRKPRTRRKQQCVRKGRAS